MSASIFHGSPGSFKSASAVWFEVLPALRKGRLVVTNIEGILPLEEIEEALQETFPEEAQLWRLSSQTKKGKHLWQRWYHWMPVGALIIMDEVQDIYPNTRSFNADHYDYQPIYTYEDSLPPAWYEYHLHKLDTLKPEELTSGDKDDLGEELFNAKGHIIYPANLQESFMRHRKYNWDIIACTPDITAVNKFIRNVAQYAYYHRYFDGIASIPYFYRRPRIHEHNPTLNGRTPGKGESKVWRKIPLEVHQCYKSTATGNITKGQGKNFFLNPKMAFPTFCLFGAIGFLAYYFATLGDDKAASQIVVEGVKVDSGNAYSVNSNKAASRQSDALELPYGANHAIFTGSLTKYRNGNVVGRDLTFTLDIDGQHYSATSEDFRLFGYTVHYLNDCAVNIFKSGLSKKISCSPFLQQKALPRNINTSISFFGDSDSPSGA
ncbi:zonular occludens toxin family protein [Pseudoalteromonas sp. T1lg22]|uniref:zonular occludens toxin family protein n=1 Tax=Pseudoalteromonas sp. T1lg22 TaxID=2077096 RepID=UPI000CF69E19|nr:zonular occludens toxin domain-containing protein [Pseudoalteromonas sp. T1lg22]